MRAPRLFEDILRPLAPLFTLIIFIAAFKVIDWIQHWPTP